MYCSNCGDIYTTEAYCENCAEEIGQKEESLRAEVERLRQELEYVALAKKQSFTNDREFRLWAQNRARHALGLKPGELTIRKERT